jgi:hypothetical protein
MADPPQRLQFRRRWTDPSQRSLVPNTPLRWLRALVFQVFVEERNQHLQLFCRGRLGECIGGKKWIGMMVAAMRPGTDNELLRVAEREVATQRQKR